MERVLTIAECSSSCDSSFARAVVNPLRAAGGWCTQGAAVPGGSLTCRKWLRGREDRQGRERERGWKGAQGAHKEPSGGAQGTNKGRTTGAQRMHKERRTDHSACALAPYHKGVSPLVGGSPTRLTHSADGGMRRPPPTHSWNHSKLSTFPALHAAWYFQPGASHHTTAQSRTAQGTAIK